jgi:hypothetical protein
VIRNDKSEKSGSESDQLFSFLIDTDKNNIMGFSEEMINEFTDLGTQNVATD